MKYQLIEHTADIGLRAFGKTPAELYANAALGMFEIVYGRRDTNDIERVTVEIEGMDAENLMVRWLSELLSLSREGWAFAGFEIIDIGEQKLRAECRGERPDRMPKPKTEIKLVTYHRLKVEKSGEGYSAEIIFDV